MRTLKKATRPSQKKITRQGAATSPKPKSPKPATNGGFGTYTVARGHVSIAVPTFWTFRQTNEDLQVQSPSGDTSVIVAAYQRNPDVQVLDARTYLDHFLQNADRLARVQRNGTSKARAGARYRDHEGNSWYVQFVTNGKMLLLAELSCAGPFTSREAKAGMAVMNSLKLKTGAK
jgi:hypothetical protein